VGNSRDDKHAEDTPMLKVTLFFMFFFSLPCLFIGNSVRFVLHYDPVLSSSFQSIARDMTDAIQKHLISEGYAIRTPADYSLTIRFCSEGSELFRLDIELDGKKGNSYFLKSGERWEPIAYRAAMTLLEILVLEGVLNHRIEADTRFTHFLSSYEYASFSQDGRFFTYISDKLTGNTNPIVINLETMEESIYVLPEASEIFPLVIGSLKNEKGPWLIFIQSGATQWKLRALAVSKLTGILSVQGSELITLDYGDIHSPCVDQDYLYYIRDGKIIQMHLDSMKRWILHPPVPYGFPQSIDVRDGIAILSLLMGSHYNLFSWDLSTNQWTSLSQTDFNEVDVRWSFESPFFVYSANPTGVYDLFIRTVEDDKPQRLDTDSGDQFYPFFSPSDRFVGFSSYTTNQKPELFLIPLPIKESP